MSDDDFLRPKEAAAAFPFTTEHLKQLRYLGRGPIYYRPSPGVILYRRGDIRAWIDGSKVAGKARA